MNDILAFSIGFAVSISIFLTAGLFITKRIFHSLEHRTFKVLELTLASIFAPVSLYAGWVVLLKEMSIISFLFALNAVLIILIYLFLRNSQRAEILLHSLTVSTFLAVPFSSVIAFIVLAPIPYRLPLVEATVFGILWGLIAAYFMAFAIGSVKWFLKVHLFHKFSVSFFTSFMWYTSIYFSILTLLGIFYAPGPREGFGFLIFGIAFVTPLTLIVGSLIGAVIKRFVLPVDSTQRPGVI